MNRYKHLPTYRYYPKEGYPLTLEKSVGKDLKKYKIYGNSVQDGIPTPDTPIEIESVGDKTKNLFDKDNANLVGGYINATQFNLSSMTTSVYIPCKADTTYTVSKIKSARFSIAYSTEAPTSSMSLLKYTTNHNTTQISSISTSDAKYLIVFLYHKTYDTVYTLEEILDTLQIEESPTATVYEPYGYKIPVTVRGKNLLDPDAFYNINTKLYSGASKVTYNNANCIRTMISYLYDGWANTKFANLISNFKENTQYTVSIDVGTEAETTFYIGFLYSDGTRNVAKTSMTETDKFYHLELTSAEGKNVIGIAFSYGANVYIYINLDTFQVEEGTTATEYEPYVEPTTYTIYLDEPLRKVESYSDYIDFTNKQIVRNIKEISLKGTESFALETSLETVGRYRLWISDYPSISTPNGLSTHYNFAANYSLSEEHFYMQNTALRIFSSYLTVDEFKGWLSTQYSDGTPVTIDYILSTLDIDDIDLPDIKTVDGTTIIEVDTTIEPTLQVQYYK